MLWIILSAIIIITTVISRWKNRRMNGLAKQLGPRSVALPFIGHAYRFLGDGEDRMKSFNKMGREAFEKGGLISHWQGNRLYILVADPEPAEVLLKTCLDKDDITRFFRVLLGNGSIFAPVPIWRPRRKILAPTFSPKNLNSFVEVFSCQSSVMVDQLRRHAGKGSFSMWKFISTYTMASVCETTLDIKTTTQSETDQPFVKAFEDCCRVDAKRICQPWLYNDTIYRWFCNDAFELYARSKTVIWNFMNEIITSKLEAMKKEKLEAQPDPIHKKGFKTFLNLLIEGSEDKCEGTGYSITELREETLVIVVAGTDTSAVGTALATLMLAKHPDVQEKVYQELQEIFGDSDRPVISEDLPRLKYLDAVVREALRLYPPVPFIVRQVQKDVTLASGITILKGCGIFISIWSIHRNPRYWGDDAEEFRPERFIDTPLKHPSAFMPFSHGPRSCLGYQYAMMSMKTALATLLRQYRVLPSEANTNTSELRVKFDVMLKDVNNFVVQLELRT